MAKLQNEIEILKAVWGKLPDGRWAIDAMKGLKLKPQQGFDRDFFRFENGMEISNDRPPSGNFQASFGTTDYLMKQSIVPIVSYVEGEDIIRCIGTGFIISCSGYLMTACHVLMDPMERGYGKVVRKGNTIHAEGGLTMGAVLPTHPLFEPQGFRLFSFHQSWYWGEWEESPLFHQKDEFKPLTDVAICKIGERTGGMAHQPLQLSLNKFQVGEMAYSIGYAEMGDVQFEIKDGRWIIPEFNHDLYVSVGEVSTLFPDNIQKRHVPAPGPCFDFNAKIPGKMSGAPIFGAQGAIVRGVVSRSFSGEKHAYGSMLGPFMKVEFEPAKTIETMMKAGSEGIPQVLGEGL